MKLRKIFLFFKKSGLWEIILGFRAKSIFSGPARKNPVTWSPCEYNQHDDVIICYNNDPKFSDR